MNKYLSAMANMDEKKIYGIFAGILLLIFLADYFVIMRPQLNALSTINADMEVKQQAIDSTNQNIQKLAQYQKQVDELKVKLEKTNALVKPIDEISVILKQISILADEYGLKIDQLKPNSQEKEILLENNQYFYYSFPILVEAQAKYHDFGKFLNALENSPICLKIVSLSISSVDRSQYHSIALSINAVVFEEAESGGQ